MTDRQFKRKLKKMQKEGERYKQIKEVSDAYAGYFPAKKEKKVSNIMLIISVVAVLGYVAAAFWVQLMTGTEISPTVTTLWFAFWTSELWALTSIKRNKIKHSYDETIYNTEDGIGG